MVIFRFSLPLDEDILKLLQWNTGPIFDDIHKLFAGICRNGYSAAIQRTYAPVGCDALCPINASDSELDDR